MSIFPANLWPTSNPMRLHGRRRPSIETWAKAFAAVPLQDETAYEGCRVTGVGAAPPPAPKRILIAEDNQTIRRFLASAVKHIGFHADTTENGEEAWQALQASRYDLLVTDHEMPKLTGLDLIVRMRKESPAPPCILISASMPHPEPVLRKLVHPGDILHKPFTLAPFVAAIHRLLRLDPVVVLLPTA